MGMSRAQIPQKVLDEKEDYKKTSGYARAILEEHFEKIRRVMLE